MRIILIIQSIFVKNIHDLYINVIEYSQFIRYENESSIFFIFNKMLNT